MAGRHAKDRAEADAELRAHCEKWGFDPEFVGEHKWRLTLGIACNPEFGYPEAIKALEADRMELHRDAVRAGRLGQVDGDRLIATIATDGRFHGSAVHGILQQMADAYVAGERVNLGLGGQPFDPETYEELRDEWTQVGRVAATLGGIFTAFAGLDPQDKALEGRGNVGATLEQRRYQGDLLATINGIRFNMHVNLTGLQ
ncbi:hypothetical protein [Streptacidiphilus rugosus]|uniref:hypothetical protein n=1 Tax=Streptacidiphilus rugosus TaxID=405783 RepID=UPI0005695720|nr:hypothetical protein [Streptacidiphilus rugosus]